MFTLKRLSIDVKLRLLVGFASVVGVSLSCLAFMTYDMRTTRGSMAKQLSALTDVLGTNTSAAINFDDRTAADEVLASLGRQPSVDTAFLFDAQGHVFASYTRLDRQPEVPPYPPKLGHEFTSAGFLDIAQPITFEGKPLGIIYVHANMAGLREQLAGYAAIFLLVMPISVGVAIILSTMLQHAISLPILNLAQTARQISEKRDFSTRVATNSVDKLGTLYNELNKLLSEIQSLQESCDQRIEKVVENREHALSSTGGPLDRDES